MERIRAIVKIVSYGVFCAIGVVSVYYSVFAWEEAKTIDAAWKEERRKNPWPCPNVTAARKRAARKEAMKVAAVKIDAMVAKISDSKYSIR